MNKELKPCPLGHKTNVLPCGTRYRVYCIESRCYIGPSRETEAEAITAWNTRPSPWIKITPETMPEKETERFSKDFLMWPMTTNGYPLGAYDFVGKRWFVSRVKDSYEPKFYMPIPTLPERKE